jgi:hypothetical protein
MISNAGLTSLDEALSVGDQDTVRSLFHHMGEQSTGLMGQVCQVFPLEGMANAKSRHREFVTLLKRRR